MPPHPQPENFPVYIHYQHDNLLHYFDHFIANRAFNYWDCPLGPTDSCWLVPGTLDPARH